MHQGKSNDVPPLLKFTGQKPRVDKEYNLCWGDYCEVRNPSVMSNTLAPRTEPCISLYPENNDYGSWHFYNLAAGKEVVRSTYKEMTTTDLIISKMNQLAAEVNGSRPSSMFDDDELLPQSTDQIADVQPHPDVVSSERDIGNDSSQQRDNGCSDVEDDASIVSDGKCV